MRALVLLIAPLLLIAAPALAEDGAPACAAADARATSIAALTADPAGAIGDCVTVEGTQVALTLLADSDARYRPEHIYNDPSSSGAAIGLIAERTRDATPQRVRVTGRVTSCEQQTERLRARDAASAAAGEQIITIPGGYCHWYHGLALEVSAIAQIGPAPLLRRPAGDNAQGLGNLAPLADGPTRAAMQAAAQRLLDAILAGDSATIRTLHGGPPHQRGADELAAVEQLLLRDPAAPFAALRGSTPATIALFGWKPPLWADDDWRAQAAAADGADAIACYSTHANAAALWPIDSRDADNRPGRPYACTAIHLSGAAGEASFDTQQAPYGADEPGQ